LSISVNTVKVHLRNVYAKLGAESRTEATMIAVREGWVTVEGSEDAPETEGGAQAPAVVPAPPLPWFKRVALIAAVPLMAVAVAVTRPDGEPQPANGPALPLNESGQQPPVTLTEDAESRWQERAQMPTRRAYLALAAVSGRIFAIAGQTPEGTSAAVEIYDPENDIWDRGTNKPTPVTYVSAATVGTDVYVPGGCDAEGAPTQSVEVYDTTTDAWREASPLPEPRCAYGLAILDDTLYLFGGWNGERYVATVYAYAPGTDLWTELAPLDVERGFAAATSLENRIYVVGGYDGGRCGKRARRWPWDGEGWGWSTWATSFTPSVGVVGPPGWALASATTPTTMRGRPSIRRWWANGVALAWSCSTRRSMPSVAGAATI
jgi:hypothetical protein